MERLFAGPIPNGTHVQLDCQQRQFGAPAPVDCRRCYNRFGFDTRAHAQSVFVKRDGVYYCVTCDNVFPWDPESNRYHFWITRIPQHMAQKTCNEFA
ncbi:hypothetical protein BK004_02385 [bacterium CG10_46_32]|nr:MAG: hypothetical protein BK004_02385 [bacterium CG10_46_32]PIR56161.1 MAG: hypothetical protein COU73_02405 [Parcubacteria group bacterium CG10_big_fil_rev_8_21_14_0_10_46_32]